MASNRSDRLRMFFEVVWNNGDITSARDFLTPAYEIHHDPGDPWAGKTLTIEGFEERARISRAPFPDQCFTILDMIEGEDRIAVTWTWRGTHEGGLPGARATGRSISMSGATIYFFQGDRICGHWQVVDRLSVMQQLSGMQA